jgi:hypothetical protein
MTGAILVSALLLAATPDVRTRYAKPLSDQATLSLTSDRETYYVGEPISLTMTMKNTGARPLQGFFAINPLAPKTQLRYRKEGASFNVFPYPGRRGGYVDVPQTLGPEEEKSGTATLAFDPGRQVPLLEHPGHYEFQVTYDDIPSDANSRIESNILAVDVQQTPDNEREALAAYSNELAGLAQFEARWSYASPELVKRAVEFADRFPSSLYAQHVRNGLRRALRDRIVRNRASKGEKELYEKLEAQRSPNQ